MFTTECSKRHIKRTAESGIHIANGFCHDLVENHWPTTAPSRPFHCNSTPRRKTASTCHPHRAHLCECAGSPRSRSPCRPRSVSVLKREVKMIEKVKTATRQRSNAREITIKTSDQFRSQTPPSVHTGPFINQRQRGQRENGALSADQTPIKVQHHDPTGNKSPRRERLPRFARSHS